jgi:hypothetical protein
MEFDIFQQKKYENLKFQIYIYIWIRFFKILSGIEIYQKRKE